MTIKEKDYCLDLLSEALKNAKQSKEDFQKASNDKFSETERFIAEAQGQNHLGYAQGIYQALVIMRYQNSKMEELKNII